jgi:NAD-dependent deacetylase
MSPPAPNIRDFTLPGPFVHALRTARHVVVFTGAGVSAESGIPTFRDALSGYWSRFDPMTLATPQGFVADPALVWGWYESRRLAVSRALPNPAHHAIAQMAQRVPQLTLITQNVDDLHERAAVTAAASAATMAEPVTHDSPVLHLHGSLHTPRCFDCGTPFAVPPDHAARRSATASQPYQAVDVPAEGQPLPPPLCPACGGLIRPGVVWFGEALPEHALTTAFHAAEHCDVLLSVGTSGVVEPAAGIPRAAAKAGAWVVHINPQAMAVPGDKALHLCGAAGVVLPQLLALL